MIRLQPFVSHPASPHARHVLYAAVGALVAILWTLHAAFMPVVFPVDDAYITLHNAAVLVEGADPNYGVSGLVGATSLLHLAMVAAFALVMPAEWALHTVMWLGVLAYATGALRLAFVHQASVSEALLILVAGCLAAEVPHQLMNGLETGWAMAALVWTMACASETLDRSRMTAALCGALPLLRPELVVVSGAVFALQAWRHWRARGAIGAALPAIIADAGAAMAVVLPFVIALWVATGSPSPGTVNAKRQFFAEGCLPAAVKGSWVTANLISFASLLGALSAAAALLVIAPLGRAGLLFILALLLAYYREFPGALSHYEHRYLYPILPFLLYGVVSVIRDGRRILRGIAVAIALASAVVSTWTAPARWQRHSTFLEFTVNELAAVAEWARRSIPPASRVLVHDAGYIAYATDLPLIDLVGLKTPLSAVEHARWTWPTCGRSRGQAVHRIALAANAEYAIVLRGWNAIFEIVPALRRAGWGVETLRTSRGGYDVFRLTRPRNSRLPGSRLEQR